MASVALLVLLVPMVVLAHRGRPVPPVRLVPPYSWWGSRVKTVSVGLQASREQMELLARREMLGQPVPRSSCLESRVMKDHRVSLVLLVLPAPMVLLGLLVVLARPSFSWVKMVSTG